MFANSAAALRAISLASGLAVAGGALAGLSDEQAAGKRLFEGGIGVSGESPQAQVGSGGLALPASALPCANCHGPDGRGRPEGGVTPPDIRWSELIKPYGHVHENRRQHGPFDVDSFRIAVTEGLDPDGNRLDQAMPRYLLAARDLENLQAYLKHLEKRAARGVDDTHVRIGTLVPLRGPLAEAGKSVQRLLESYFARINAEGGVYGRQLELVVAEYVGDPERSLDNLTHLLDDGDGVFALLSPFAAGFEPRLTDLAQERDLPVLAPVVLELDNRPAANTHVFHLLSGGTELARVLADYARDTLELDNRAIALVQSAGPAWDAAAQAVASHLERRGGGSPQQVIYRPGLSDLDAIVGELETDGSKAVILLGPALDPVDFGAAAARADWYPELLLPGPFASPGVLTLPPGFDRKVFVSYPSLPSDRERPVWQDYVGLLAEAGIERGPHATLVASFAGAELLVEALKRTGRELSRDSMVVGLEKVQGFESGLLPPLTYNTTRRIGALGGYIVAVDLTKQVYRPIGPWHSLD